MARDINNRSPEFVGLDQKIWMTAETGGFGAAATGGLFPTGTDAIEHTTASVDFTIPRDASATRSGRSVVTRLSGKRQVKFSLESYIIPGTPDGSQHPTLPDSHLLMLSAFGICNQTNPAVIEYQLGHASTNSIRVLEEGTHMSRLAYGCVIDTLTFTLPGDGKAMMKAEGFGQDVKVAGQTLIAATATATNVLTLTTGEGARFEVGAYVDVIDATDGSTRIAAARQISAADTSSITVGGAAITAAIGSIVIGAAPDFSADSSADALLGLQGTFTTALMGTVDCQLMSAEISIKNNYTQKDFLYGTSEICGFIADKRRDVSIKLEVLLTKDNFEFYMNNKQFLADNLSITLAPQDIPAPINSATGRTWTFSFPRVEFNVPAIEMPADGYMKLTLDGVAMAVDTNTLDTEMTLNIS